MTTVLALDLATRSGYALLADDVVLASGSWSLASGIPTGVASKPSPEARHAQIVRTLRRQVAGILAHHRVDVVAIERDFGRGAGGRLLACLQNAAQEAALEAGVAALSIPLATWRAETHGKPPRGAARRTTEWFKSEAMRLCAATGREALDEDEAEAILIGRYAIRVVRFHAVAAPKPSKRRRAA